VTILTEGIICYLCTTP